MFLRPMAVLALICGLAFFVACGNTLLSGQANPGSKPREALLSAIKAKLNATSYRAKSVESSEGTDSVLEGDYVAPDKYHVFSRYGGSNKVETIVLGNVAYVKQANGKWRTYPHPEKLEFTEISDQMLIAALSKSSDAEVRFLGKQDADGSRTLVYVYSWGSKDTNRGQLKAWVGSDGFPHQLELEASIQGANIKETATFYDYNADIAIRSPL